MKEHFISGAAAEAYVHYRLRSWGVEAQFAGGIQPVYDIWAEIEGSILKIQIKSTAQKIASGQYLFTTRRGSGLYAPEDWDIMALVALPEQAAWFTLRKDVRTRQLPADRFTAARELESWDRVLRLLGEQQND